MYPRTEYEMTANDLSKLMEAFKPVPYMVIGGHEPRSPQENANAAWAELGKRMGFDHMTVRPVSGKGNRFFSAVPSENETQRAERVAREQEENRQREIAKLDAEISERQERLRVLNAPADPIGDVLRGLPVIGVLNVDNPSDPRHKNWKL